ncbi:Aste57867_21627 [Aphanomyces stellatus]|uniref:Aste57867_21627 protein n=1 Tax=Aphanomyces stellatus TaxID=120398 RepID=A0A485LJA0_9STRA|nr:hypothetical protein As57867_021558 [Aphanomyces stellatus]VFT98297.1 Aste57867_21627 [Aphanomyces stellatus]
MATVTLEAVVHDPHMHAIFLKYLSAHDEKNFARLLFLVSVDEFKKLVPDDSSSSSPTSQRVNYVKKIIHKYMDEDSFFYLGRDMTLPSTDAAAVPPTTIAAFGRLLLHDLHLCSGLSSNRDLFLDVETAVLSEMAPSFHAFSTTKAFQSLMSMEILVPSIDDVELQHATSSFTLERVLANRRLCCVFWLFLFKERTHGPLSFWMETTHRVLPQVDAFCHASSSSSSIEPATIAHLGHVLLTKYFIPGATAELHVVGDVQLSLVLDLQTDLARWKAGDVRDAAETAARLRHLLRHVKETLQMNHFVRFIQSPAFHTMLLSPSRRLCLSPSRIGDDDDALNGLERSPSHSSNSSTSSSDSTSLQDVVHVMNVLSHQPPHARFGRLPSTAASVVHGVLYFSLDPARRRAAAALDTDTLFADGALPEHLDAFLTPMPSRPPLVRSQAPPPPALFHLTIGATDRPFYMVCLTRYVPVASALLNPLELVLLEQKQLQLFVLTGLCLLSRVPVFDAMRARLAALHDDSDDDDAVLASVAWRPSAAQLAALVAPVVVPAVPVSSHALFTCLSIPNVLSLLATLLCERKVLFVSSHLSTLTTVAEAARRLLAPLHWPHVFVPVLPDAMLELLHCPTPFVFGIHAELRDGVDTDDVVVVDLDADRVTSASAPLAALPQAAHLVCALQRLLQPHVACADWVTPPHDAASIFPDAEVAALCRAAWTAMMDEMDEFSFVLSDEGDSMVVFDSIGFLAKQRKDTAAFYKAFLKTQLFSQYIATRGVASADGI